MAEIKFIEIPDFSFAGFYYPDLVRSLTIYARANVPEITDESDEEPFTQLIRAFALVGHLNNVLLDVVATETLLPTARLLESVRSHLRLIDVILEQAKPAAADVVVELATVFLVATNFIPAGTQVATVETDDSPQILYEANTDNVIQPTDVAGNIFSFDPAYVQFLANVFHAGDIITVEGVDFEPGVNFAIGANLIETIDNFVNAFNISTDVAIENLLRAYRKDDRAIISFLSDDLVSVTVSVIDNTPETTLVDQTTAGTDAPLSTGTERRADDFTPSFDRTIKNVTYSLKKAGVPTGNVRCVIEGDDGGGLPDGVPIATSTTLLDITTITGAYVSYEFDFATTAKIVAGTKYWFILEYESPVGISDATAEVTNIQVNDGANPALPEITDVLFNDNGGFFDVRGAAKHFIVDAQGGTSYYGWLNVTDGTETQADGEFETSTLDFSGQTGATHDVIGAANYLTFFSATDATSYYLWFNVTDGANVQADPTPGGTGIQVDVILADTDAALALKAATPIDLLGDFDAVSALAVVTMNATAIGITTDSADVSTGATVLTTKQGTAILVAGKTAVQIDILLADTVFEIAQKTVLAFDALGDFGALLNGGNTARITQANAGTVTDAVDVDSNATITVFQQGTVLSNDYDVNGTALHFLLDAVGGTLYYVWFNVTDGTFVQADPAIGARVGIQIDILKADANTDIATKMQVVVDLIGDFGATVSTDTLVVTQIASGPVADAVDVDANVTIVIDALGSDETRVVMDSSGAGGSTYFTSSAWSIVTTSLVMKILADSTNFAIRSGGFGLDKSGQSIINGATFPMMALDPIPGSLFYVSHSTVMWDALEFTLDTNGLGITGVWEFYDGNVEDGLPDSVTNLGSNLEFDLTTLMGELDRSGALLQVTFTGNGVSELVNVIFDAGLNKVRTTGLLGQVTVSTDANEYIVGLQWNEVSNINDGIQDFTQNGLVKYNIPQDQTQNWTKKTINTFEGFPLRYRVIDVVTPFANPIIDLVDITADKQYVIFPVTQGDSKTEDPLGTSDGSANQKFELAFKPLIVESLVVEVDEGTGFSAWNNQDNFLTSTQISKDYTLEVTADDTATITFGDGQNGKTPSAGVDNIRVSYRVFSGGTANDGNVGARTITVNKAGVAFINRVFNPRAATGFSLKEGSTQEDLARLKIAGPATLRVRNRGITPDDFEFLATEYTTDAGTQLVTRALAVEETFGIKTIELIVVGSGGALLTQTQLDDLSKFFNGSKPDNIKGVGLTNHEVTSVNYTPRIINVVATVQGGNAATITNALSALLNPEAKFDDGVTFRWAFDDVVPLAILSSTIINTDAQNIKNVLITTPATDIDLAAKELPLAGTITITII